MAGTIVLGSAVPRARRFRIGLVGAGPAAERVARILGRPDFHRAFPAVKPACRCLAPTASAPSEGCPPKTFAGIKEMFAFYPGLHLVLDLSPTAEHMEELRRHAPVGVTLASHTAILNFCDAAEEGRLSIAGGENLQKAQSLLSLLVDQFEDDIVVLDEAGLILDVNRHTLKRLDLRREDVVGRPCDTLDFFQPECEEHGAKVFLESRTGGRRAEYAFTRMMPDGKVRHLQTFCFPILDPTCGRATRFLYIRRDVTEKQHLEQRLQQTEKMAAIGELSTYIAHEIRNPIFAIGGFANALLRNSSINADAREKARIIFEESRRLDEILKNILNFARPTEQKMGIFDPGTVARQTIELMTIGCRERGINALTDIASNLPKITGNAENLKQCLINLVKNALEAMPDGGDLSLWAYRDDGHVVIMVQDTGVGIPAELHEQVFSPFFSTKHGGAGLGLAMTRKVVEEMGGKVHLRSVPNQGTSVILRLPAALDVEDPSLPEAP